MSMHSSWHGLHKFVQKPMTWQWLKIDLKPLKNVLKTNESRLTWTPQSPDLNPTKYLQRHLKTEKAKPSVKSWEAL